MGPGELTAVVSAAVATIINAGQAAGQLGGARRGKSERDHSADVAKRMLYGEILFNLFALKVGSKVVPPRLVLQNAVYRGLIASGHLSLVGGMEVLADVATAYTVSELTIAAFDVDWLQLAIMRVRGIDSDSLEVLAARFRDAEQAMRTTAWNDEQRKRIEEQLEANEALIPVVRASLSTRLQSAGLSVPGSLLVAGLYVATHGLTRSRHERR
jgi:hypothetical protein